ncbi:MAG: hypothetical protein M1833_000025 [Piccolia ochrophora]|nr:MAG: hypothetical protein M1833_000025 [Piccolia ochrophora]
MGLAPSSNESYGFIPMRVISIIFIHIVLLVVSSSATPVQPSALKAFPATEIGKYTIEEGIVVQEDCKSAWPGFAESAMNDMMFLAMAAIAAGDAHRLDVDLEAAEYPSNSGNPVEYFFGKTLSKTAFLASMSSAFRAAGGRGQKLKLFCTEPEYQSRCRPGQLFVTSRQVDHATTQPWAVFCPGTENLPRNLKPCHQGPPPSDRKRDFTLQYAGEYNRGMVLMALWVDSWIRPGSSRTPDVHHEWIPGNVMKPSECRRLILHSISKNVIPQRNAFSYAWSALWAHDTGWGTHNHDLCPENFIPYDPPNPLLEACVRWTMTIEKEIVRDLGELITVCLKKVFIKDGVGW